jgi:2-polyprenyl-3-methyl-5-hydroxy-6-metoxy-1,4-benzoquinol methylase
VASKTTVEQLYGEIWADDGSPELARASPARHGLAVRGVRGARPAAGQLVVDIGRARREARDPARREHGLRAIALDPVAHHVELARRAVAEAGVDVDVVQAGIEAMPIDDGAADWIWCRDVLVHVDLARGFAECARILGPAAGCSRT